MVSCASIHAAIEPPVTESTSDFFGPKVACVSRREASVAVALVSVTAGGVPGATKVCEPMPAMNAPRNSPAGKLAVSSPT